MDERKSNPDQDRVDEDVVGQVRDEEQDVDDEEFDDEMEEDETEE